MRSKIPGAVFLLILIVCLAGCSKQNVAKQKEVSISWTHFDVPKEPKPTPQLLAKGKTVFQQNCAACHGENGAGNGKCAAFLLPHPRDFTSGVFRFKMTPGGEMPTDQDLFRTVSLGLHNTGMPPWRYLLSDEDRWAVVNYIKTFSPRFHQPAATAVSLGKEPQVTPEFTAKGEKLYQMMQCGKCHGEEGYGDGPSADTLVDSFGNPISPRNFHKAAEFKRGHTLNDIALTVSTGNNGTPMPSFGDSLKPEEVWQLAAYVQSLADKKYEGGGTQAVADIGEDLGKPDITIQVRERSWTFVPDVIRVPQGKIVKIQFQPTDNGLGAGHGFAIDGFDRKSFINGAMVQRPKSLTFLADKAGTYTFYCATQCSTGSLHPMMKGTLIIEAASR